jgi:hypothetical protein
MRHSGHNVDRAALNMLVKPNLLMSKFQIIDHFDKFRST